MPGEILFLSREDVRAELGLADCIQAVEEAFKSHTRGLTPCAPGILGAHLNHGGFHIKTAALGARPCWFAAKINGNFPLNPERHSLPTIQGVIVLCDGERGSPLAVMDSIEITILRTAVATAIAAKHLSKAEAATLTICGCGNQGVSHLRALALVRRLRRVLAFDLDARRARRFTEEMGTELGIEVVPVDSLADAVRECDICVTCTPSREPIVTAAMLHPGLFIAAVGADSSDKQELAPEVLQRSKVVVDILDQAATIGDLHHAIVAGVMGREDVYAELGQILLGERPGRISDNEVFVFDSTGTALQDTAAASLVYERAGRSGRGKTLNLARPQ